MQPGITTPQKTNSTVIPDDACPVCGQRAAFSLKARDYHYGNPGIYTLYHCGACGHNFQYPLPQEKELEGYYPTTYYAHQSIQSDAKPRYLRHPGRWVVAHYCRLRRGYTHLRLWPNPALAFLGWCRLVRKRRDLNVPRYRCNGSLCDFGCGSGGALTLFQLYGWKAEGIEISEAAVAAGRSAGLQITRGSIEVLESRPKAFDVIRSSHCVEHMSDIQRLFRAFYHALRPGGLLAIEVPNGSSAAAEIYRDGWYYLGLPTHVHLFSPLSLTQIAAQNGFEGITIETLSFWQTHAASWLLCRDLRARKESPQLDSRGRLEMALARIPTLGSFLRSLPAGRGDCLILVCRRPASGAASNSV